MGVQFYAAKRPANPENLRGWKLGNVTCDVSATSASQLLQLLGYDVDPAVEPTGSVTPEEMLARLSIAKIEGLTVAYERWGRQHFPGYFELRLNELAEVAREAQEMTGEVFWA